ncbi:MAG: hypothetical protein E7Z67_01975 [Thermoplasmata archaeon]|nr:hypothetical protein [Thermoplasmata archaeon]
MSFKKKGKSIDPKLYLNESPAVISLMSSIVTSGGSLDAAVRKVAADGPKNTSRMFTDLISRVDCRADCDIRDSILELISRFPEGLAPLRRSILMTISATDAKTVPEKVRIMSEATEVILHGIKQTGETYISKLQFPCMAVFGIGIMVPMIVLSLAPMLGIGGMFTMPAGFDERTVRMVVLFLVPLSILAVMVSIKDRNPFMDSEKEWNDVWRVAPILVSIPVAYALAQMDMGVMQIFVVSVVTGSLAVRITVSGPVKREKERAKIENAIRNCLFDLGNRMVTGVNFDSALVEALSMRKESSKLALALEREYVLCRGDIQSAIFECVGPYSNEMANVLCRILVASYRDVRDAGRMATAIAHQFQNEESVRKDMSNKLRGITDMMNGTAAVFAPLILGMSIMMMSPLAQMVGAADVTSTFVTIAVYVVELAALISVFTSLLGGRFRAINVIERFSLLLPVAMVILFVCSSISI